MDITPNNRAAGPQPVQQNHHVAPQRAVKGRRPLVGGIIVLIIVVLIVLGGWLWWSSRDGGQQTKAAAIDTKNYQAVFLTNGQVYFGKLHNTGGNYLQMTDIYYLQVQQSVQPSTGQPANQTSDDQKTQLVKLGNELHGPQDSMQISTKQVLFWENLKADGKVSKAISSYKP